MKLFKRILVISSRILIVLAVVAGVVYALRSDEGTCKGIVVNIKSIDGDNLMTVAEVESRIKKSDIIGKTFEYIDLLSIESKIKKMPYVQTVNAVAGISGDLNINITQCQPIARLINTNGDARYLTADSSKLVKVSKDGSIRVPVVMGDLRFTDKKMIGDLELLLAEIKRNEFMSSYTQQILVEGNGRFSIVGLTGSHKVEVGRTDNLQDKFNRLERFYDKGLSKAGWDKYSVVSIEFDKQVVCR